MLTACLECLLQAFPQSWLPLFTQDSTDVTSSDGPLTDPSDPPHPVFILLSGFKGQPLPAALLSKAKPVNLTDVHQGNWLNWPWNWPKKQYRAQR